MYSKFRKRTRQTGWIIVSAILLAGTLVAAPLHPHSIAHAEPSAAVSAIPAVQEQAAPTYRIIAIGDSLTAGYEPGLSEDSKAYGYVERIYEQALFHGRAAYSNYGILGLKLDGLNNWLKAAYSGASITADDIQAGLLDPRTASFAATTGKLHSDIAQADLVLITIGGNDFKGLFDQLPSGRSVSDAWLAQELEHYEQSLESSIRMIAAISPTAKIVISDQYSPIPNSPLIMSEENYDYLLDAAAGLKERLEQVVNKLTQEGYAVKGAYSASSFVQREASSTHILSRDIHPNQQGYGYIADGFTEAIWGEKRMVAEREEGVPISIVVDGTELRTANKPFIRANRTYVAFRDIADAMGATTQWDNSSRTVIITYGMKEVSLRIGEPAMTVNGKRVAIDTPAYLQQVGKERKTYVPLAVLAGGLGFQVEYRAPIRTAFINK